MSYRSRLRSTFPVVLAVLILFLVAFIVWQKWSLRGIENVAGIYVTNGGRSFLVIEHEGGSRLNVPNGLLLTLDRSYFWPDRTTIEASYSNGRLFLNQNERNHYSDNHWFPDIEDDLWLRLVPSGTVPGDWDLVEGTFTSYTWARHGWNSGGFFTKGFWEDLLQRFGNALGATEPSISGAMEPSAPPIRSFLHRIDDPRLVRYFEARLDGKFSPQDVEELRQIVADRPEDPYVQMHAIEVEAASGDAELATELLSRWKENLEGSPDVCLREAAKIAFKAVWNRQGLPEGEDLREVLDRFAEETSPLQAQIETLERILKNDILLTTTEPLVEPIRDSTYLTGKVYTDLGLHTGRRCIEILAVLDFLHGDERDGLTKLASLYRLGQMLNSDGIALQRIRAWAIRLSVVRGLQMAVLNTCQGPEEVRLAWEVLKKLDETPGQETGATVCDGEWSTLLAHMKPTYVNPLSKSEYRAELAEHTRAEDAKFQLTRMAVAVKDRLLKAGEFPQSASDFAPLFGGGLPKDPFTSSALRFTEPGVEPFAVFSVGPDGAAGTDDDITLEIPSERKYPFPCDGVRAANAMELLEQFPNGLPRDPFADVGTTLSIIDSSTDTPVTIFSIGPSGEASGGYVNERCYRMPGIEPATREVGNDATFQRVFTPAKPVAQEADVEPVEIVMPPVDPQAFLANPFGEPMEEWAPRNKFEYEMSLDTTKPVFRLGPYYDPTNGTKSEGHLFIEIPR